MQFQNSLVKCGKHAVAGGIGRQREATHESSNRTLNPQTPSTGLRTHSRPDEKESISIQADLDFLASQAGKIKLEQILVAGVRDIHGWKPVRISDATIAYRHCV